MSSAAEGEKVMTSSEQSSTDAEAVMINEFLEAMKKIDATTDFEEGLKKVFQVLSKGQENAHISADDLRRGIENHGLNLTTEEVEEKILLVKPKEKEDEQKHQINCEEFIKIIKLLEPTVVDQLTKIYEILCTGTDSEEELKKAFQVLSNGQDTAHLSADDLCRGIKNRGLNLTAEKVEETILHVKPKEKEEEQKHQINCEEFIKIIKLLEKRKTIVLFGEPGVGKTWMARKVAARALRQGEFDVAIWVYLNRIYEKGLCLHESIAYQLSVLAAFEESEAEEAKKKAEEAKKKESEKDKVEQDEPEVKKENNKQEKIERMIHKALKGKRLLLILDGEGRKMKLERPQVHEKGNEKMLLTLLAGKTGEDELQDHIDLGKILDLNNLKSCNVLITSRDSPPDSGDIGIKVEPLTWHESKSLVFKEMEVEDKSKIEDLDDLVDFFIGETERLPAQILIIAKVVSFYFKKKDARLLKLRSYKETHKKETDLKVQDILIREYENLPITVLTDCFSSETRSGHFLRRGGMVNFNELISYWIMEGHLGRFDRIEDAYEEGHRVLMELLDCGLLQKQEGDYVTPSEVSFNLNIHDREKFFRKIHPGLAVTFDMKLGKVALADGMIKTVSSSGQEEEGKTKLSTLLLDGNRIGEELPAKSSSKQWNELEVYAVFNPTHQHFQLPIRQMQRLRLLMLRGCRFLDSIEHNFQWRDNQENQKEENQKVPRRSHSFPTTQKSSTNPSLSPSFLTSEKLDNLTALEISGPSSLKTIPDDLFQKTPHLKTLNMSFLPIESLPKSFYHLTKIEFLILRGCSRLKELEILETFKDLQVLDIAGATSFEKFHDKSLKENAKLQILNLSETKIKTLPLINPCQELKFISLSDCTELQRIRMISKLKRLQIFDISGAKLVEEFCDPSLEDLQSLVILDVSRTAIKRLPSNICNPRYLYLKDCLRLRRLPPIEGFSKVEVIDLSGSTNLREIRTEFFKDVKGLKELNLSKTGLKDLPFLSSLISLRRLSLSKCQYLEKLENLSCLKNLEFLDLSGCNALKEMEEKSFEKMSRLYYLNLSEIQLKQLPSLSKLVMLEELHVRDCPNLTELTGIEELPAIKILDHSGTILNPTPSLSNRDPPPRVLGASADNIDQQQLLKKLGANTAEFTPEEPESTDLREDGLRECKWSISNWKRQANTGEDTQGEAVYGFHFLHLLKKHPSLLTKNFSRFHFLVSPSEVEMKDKSSYMDELSLRDIYFEQVTPQKLERCLEIREFGYCPPFTGHLLKQTEFVVLIDNPFFKTLLTLGVENIMDIKALWIESCNELEHVIASKKVQEADKGGESAENKGDPGKNSASEKVKETAESAKSKGDQGKNSASQKVKDTEKGGDSAKSKGDQRKNSTPEKVKETGKEGELAESKGDQGKNSASEKVKEADKGESAKSKGDEGKNSASEKVQETDKEGESAERKGDQGKNSASEKVKETDNEGESAKSKGDEGKNSASEKVQETDKEGESAESKADQGKNSASEKVKETDKEGESAESKADQGKNSASGKVKETGKEGESAESKGDEGKNSASEKLQKIDQTGESDERKGDHAEVKETDKEGESAKSKGDRKNSSSEKVQETDKTGELDERKGDEDENYADIVKNLEILWISDAMKLMSISNGDIQSISFRSLKSLYLEYCPELSMICSSSLQLESLEILYVKYCQKLETLFTDDDSAQLIKLTKLQLWGLEEFKGIAIKLPSLRVLRVGECPMLEHVINASTQGHEQNEVEGHPNLETLHIKFCDNLKTICESSQDDMPYFPKLRELEASGLPELQRIECRAPSLHSLKVGECPSLQHIAARSDVPKDLQIMEIKYCDKLKTIFGKGGLVLEKVEKMQLLSLPELDSISGDNLLPSLTLNWTVWGCPKLQEVKESQNPGSNDARNP